MIVADRSQSTERELSDLLGAYSIGWKTLADFAEWLSGVNWEQIDVKSALAAKLGELDLLCTEVREGLRPESDFASRVSDLVADTLCVRYSVSRPAIMVSSSSSTAGFVAPVLSFSSKSPQEELV